MKSKYSSGTRNINLFCIYGVKKDDKCPGLSTGWVMQIVEISDKKGREILKDF